MMVTLESTPEAVLLFLWHARCHLATKLRDQADRDAWDILYEISYNLVTVPR